MEEHGPQPISRQENRARQKRVETTARSLGFVGLVAYRHVYSTSGGAQFLLGATPEEDILLVFAEAFRRDAAGMWRVIVRVSYFHDSQSRLRNHVAGLFVAMGLQNTHTGTWESSAVPLARAAAQLSRVMQAIANPQSVPGVDPQAALGHLWVYIDPV